MALGLLQIIFIVIAVVSGIGITFLYFTKNQKIKNVLFYFLVLWGMGIAYLNITRLASNYLGQQLIGWVFGFIAVAGIVIKIMKPEKTNLAQLLVTASILLSMAQLFFF